MTGRTPRRRTQICRDRVADREAEDLAEDREAAEASEAEDRAEADRGDPSVADRADPTGISADRGWAGDRDRPTEDRRSGADRPADRTMADASRGDAAVACRLSALWRLQSSARFCSRFCCKKRHPHIALAMCGCFCGKDLTNGEKCGTIKSDKYRRSEA